jgi:hypothetical protein
LFGSVAKVAGQIAGVGHGDQQAARRDLAEMGRFVTFKQYIKSGATIKQEQFAILRKSAPG